MKLSEKNKKINGIDLESDLQIGPEDLSALKKLSSRPNISLEEYIDFLEDIAAFESRKPQPVIFSEVFSL
jgi:hypothetical protein